MSNTNLGSSSVAGNIIHSQKIKPLILEKVIVKAKKAKEKDDNADEIKDIESVAKNEDKEEIFES